MKCNTKLRSDWKSLFEGNLVRILLDFYEVIVFIHGERLSAHSARLRKIPRWIVLHENMQASRKKNN